MREIKFRAWDNQTKQFHYWSAKENKYDGIFWEMIKRPEFEAAERYTGLNDKNGKEIYENHVVKGRYTRDMGEINQIIWGDYCFCVFGVGPNGFEYGFACSPSEAKELEVIGNIHNNPELLAQKGN